MKKSLLALAALTAFAGAASAQSSVTLYGRVDLSVAKNIGSDAKGLQNGSGSRFGVRGTEDLGGGLGAFFNIEHRYNADTGAMSDTSRMWGGRSLVGLQGGFGKVTLGREYTTAFLMSQLAADPFGWDTVAAQLTAGLTGGGVARVRNDSSVTYNIGSGGFGFGAQIAEANDTINTFVKKPVNFAVSYKGGPIAMNLGYEKTGQTTAAKWTTFAGSYDFGMMKLGALIGNGTNTGGAKVKSYMLTATAPVGAGEFRVAFGDRKVASVSNLKGVAVGYHYSLSKRTTIYADVANNNRATTSKSGYDFGIKHNF